VHLAWQSSSSCWPGYRWISSLGGNIFQLATELESCTILAILITAAWRERRENTFPFGGMHLHTSETQLIRIGIGIGIGRKCLHALSCLWPHNFRNRLRVLWTCIKTSFPFLPYLITDINYGFRGVSYP